MLIASILWLLAGILDTVRLINKFEKLTLVTVTLQYVMAILCFIQR
jgi:hypothetical protein